MFINTTVLIVLPLLCIAAGVICCMRCRFDKRYLKQRLIADAAPGQYIYFDLNNQMVFGSKNCKRYLGVSCSKPISLKKFLTSIEKNKDTFETSFTVLREGVHKVVSHVMPLNQRMCHITMHGVEDKWGEVAAAICWIYDISGYEEQALKIQASGKVVEDENQKLKDIYNYLALPLWCRDHDGKMLYSNRQFDILLDSNAKAFGRLKPDEELGQGVKSLTEYFILDGKRRSFQLREYEMPDGGILGFAVEMTALKRKEEEIKDYDRANEQLLNSSLSAMAIYGKSMRLEHYNAAFVALWGMEEQWLDTRPTYPEVLEQLRKARKIPEHADYKKFRNDQVNLFRELVEPHDDFYYLPNGRTIRVVAIPHVFGGVLFAYEDLTDNLSMERSYNTLMAVQKETLDNLNEAVVTFGEDGRVQLYNPKYSELWPGTEEVLKTQPHYEDLVEVSQSLIKSKQQSKIIKERLNAQAADRMLATMRIERTDGKVVDRTSIPLPDGATLISYVDVTDSTLLERSLRERNEALEESDRIKENFLANISYELRTPLTSILGLADILDKQLCGPLNPQQAGYITDIQSASEQLLELINDVLDMTSIEAGYMKLNTVNIAVEELLQEVMPVLQHKAQEKQLVVSLECEIDVGCIDVDPRRFKQVILNIFNNAFEFASFGGSVNIAAKKANGKVAVEISDDGMGMSEEERDKAFNLFYQSRGDKQGGGLGLSVAKQIVELHGGTIAIESQQDKGIVVKCHFASVVCKVDREGA